VLSSYHLKEEQSMDQAPVFPQIQYVVSPDGQRTAVVLQWKDYQSLRAQTSLDPDMLMGLDESELKALAEGMLSPSHQERLDELLRRNRKGGLNDADERELERLLARVDSMNTLKARALYTLQRLDEAERE